MGSVIRRSVLTWSGTAALASAFRPATAMTSHSFFDGYAHVLSPDRTVYPPRPLGGEALRPGTFDQIVGAASLAAEAPAQSVTRLCLVQRIFVYGYDNRLVVEAARSRPDLFVAAPVVDPDAGTTAADIARWHRERVIGSVRIVDPRHDAAVAWMDTPAALRLWDQAEDLGLTMNLELYPSNNREGLARLLALLAKRPRSRAVVDNLAVPDTAGPPEFGMDGPWQEAVSCPNLFFKVATGNLARLAAAGIDPAAFLRRAVDLYGARRLLWGSDHGQTAGSYADKLRLLSISTARLTGAERHDVTWATAERLLWRTR